MGVNPTKKVNGLRVFWFIYGFARPLWPMLVAFPLLYASQQAVFAVMNAALMGGITGAIVNGSSADLLTAGLTVLSILVFVAALLYPGVLMFATGGLKTTRRLQTRMFRAFVSADAEGRTHSGEQLSALNTDVTSASQLYDNALAGLLLCLIPIVTLSVAVFVIEWRMGLFTVFAGLFTMAGQYLFAKPLANIAKGTLEAAAEATKSIGDLFTGGVIARVFSLQERLLAVFGHSNERLRRLAYREARVGGAQKLFSGVSQLLTTGGVFVMGSILISGGQLTLTALMAMVPMCTSVAEAVASVGNAWAGMHAPLEAGRRIYSLLNGDNRLDPLPQKAAPSSAKGYAVEVSNLVFAFQGAEKPVLNGVSLRIEENRLVVFRGESGSGKSTLLKVIAGLYDRGDLPMSVGGVPFSAMAIEEWRSRFAYVDQSCTLFNLTIAENIALGKQGATREEIVAAAQGAGAEGFILALPRGYDTPVGEVGSVLSGGQRQRIALARALIRRSPVLVFDEVTSALDRESEREVLATIDRLRAGHTILMVTHSQASIRPDVTVRVESGRAMIT